jgi:urease accessory protein
MARPRPLLRLTVASGFSLTLAVPAWAHSGLHRVPTFLEGVVHPLTGWDHLTLLTASGVAMALSLDQRSAPGRWEYIGLAGLFASGIAVMLGNPLLGFICLGLSGAALVASPRPIRTDRPRFARIGAIAAIGLQVASHFLASGDLVANLEFAAGFAFTSTSIFVAAYGVTRAALFRVVPQIPQL